MQFETIKAALSDISRKTSHTYESNYTSTFLIMKNSCDYDDGEFLSHDDVSELTRWLARKQYKWFRFIDDDDDDEIWYKVQIQVSKEYVGDNVIGLRLIVTANAPYGFTREFTKSNTELEEGEDFDIRIYSDEEGYIYPTCVVTCPTAGTLTITNTTEGRVTRVANCSANEVITFIGEDTQQIISSDTTHDFTKHFNYVFPRLYVEYGNYNNTFECEINGETPEVTFSFRGIRKVGFDG